MKQLLLLSCIFFVCRFTSSLAQDATEQPRTVMLTIDQLKQFGYSGGTPDRTKQPISSKDDALIFIRRISNLNDVALSTIQGDIQAFIGKADAKEDDKFAIIVVKHPLNLQKLYADNPQQRVVLSGQYDALAFRRTRLNELIAAIDARADTLENLTKRDAAGRRTPSFNPTLLTEARVRELNDLEILRKNSVDQIAPLEKSMSELRTAFIKISSEILEEEKIESLILDYNDQEWTNYLLDVDRVMYVLIGGPGDIQKGSLNIDNKPSSFQTSLNDLIQVATPLLVGTGIPDVELKDKLPVTFLLVKRKKIKSPSTLEFVMDDKDKKISNDIHEKARFGLQLGFSAAMVSRENFTLNAENELTIEVDDEKKDELKSNLIALIEIIPWGRDIDRLESVFAKNKDVNFFDMNRLALVAGVKLSKDPLQSMYGGISYALSKTVSLDFGLSFDQTAKEVTDLPVGVNASLDYLKENADQEVKTHIFFGISFSPMYIGKSLNIVK